MINLLNKSKITDEWQNKLDDINAIYYFIIGGRNGRKSSKIQMKLLTNYLQNKKRFVLVRRKIDETISVKWFTPYVLNWLAEKGYTIEFEKQLEQGEKYTGYFLIIDSKGNSDILGKVMYLSVEQKYKSNEAEIYKLFDSVVYEEFIAESDKAYLHAEPQKLVNLVSTVFRDRSATIYLIGNTLDGQETNPFFRFFELDDMDMKVNTIYELENEEHTKIALFYVANILPSDIPQYQKIKGNTVGTTGEWKESKYLMTEKLNDIRGDIKPIPMKLKYRNHYYYIYEIQEQSFERPYIYITNELLTDCTGFATLDEFRTAIPERHQPYDIKMLAYLYPSHFRYNFETHQYEFLPDDKSVGYTEFNIDDSELKKELSRNDNARKLEQLNQYLLNMQVFSCSKSLIYWLKNERKDYVKNLIW